MIRSYVFRGRAMAIGALLLAAVLIAGLVAEAYAYPMRGGTPVSVNIVANTLSANQDSIVQVGFDEETARDDEVTIVYKVLNEGREEEWKNVLLNPSTKFWSNATLLQFKIKRNNQPVPEILTLEISVKSGSTHYPNVKDTVVLQ